MQEGELRIERDRRSIRLNRVKTLARCVGMVAFRRQILRINNGIFGKGEVIISVVKAVPVISD